MNSVLKNEFPELQGYVVSNPADIFYLTGFYCVEGLLLYSDNPVIVTDSRYEVAAKAANCEALIISGSNYVSGVIDTLKKQGITSIGIQETSLTAGDYITLNGSGFDLVPTHGIFKQMRCKKTESEIAKIKAAQAITDIAFTEILDFIKPGVTEKQIRARLEYSMFLHGADGLAFETIVASGVNGAKPHAVPSDKVIEKGELVTLDYGARLGQYNSDMTRTVAVGAITDDMKRIYNAVLEAHLEAAKLIKAGEHFNVPDLKAREVLKEYDLAQYFSHSLGHGVGIEIHEAPTLNMLSNGCFEVGNIVTDEPGVYIEGYCGVRIENMLAVTSDGAENLTASPRELIIL